MKTVIYQNATIINGDKSIEPIKDGVLVVDEHGKIAFVGTREAFESNDTYAGAKVIDLSGKYIMPGLINAHAHFFNSGKPINNFPPKLIKFVTSITKSRLGHIYLHFAYRQNYRTAVNAGITTVRDMGSFFWNDIKCRDYFNRDKGPIGPRIIASGKMITSTGGHGYEFPDRTVVDNPWADHQAVRSHEVHLVDWIKICNTAGVSDAKFDGQPGQPTMTVTEIEAACSEAHTRGYLVASHCESTEGIRRALEGGVDTIEHGAEITPELIPLFLNNPKALRGYSALVPTLSAFLIPDFKDKLKKRSYNELIVRNTATIAKGCIKGFVTAVNNGILVGTGNDASVPRVPQYYLYQELLNFQKYGKLTPKEVIHIATVDTAKLINMEGIIGALNVGYSADFIVLNKNPLDNLENLIKPLHVIARGRAIMRPKYKTFKGM